MPSLLVLLAAALAVNVLLGPLGWGVIQWRVSDNLLNQTYGADAAMLALVVPTCLAAAWLWRSRHRLAAPLALGAGLAALYYGIAEVLGADYIRYPGNNERFFLLFLVVIILSWVVAARAWTTLDPAPPLPPRWLARGFGAVLLAAATVMSLAWMSQLVAITVSGAVGAEYLESPAAFWTIRIVDLGFIVPIAFGTGIRLWRGSPAASRAAYGLAAFLTLQAAAVLAMGGVMLWHNDPTATPLLVYTLLPISVALAACTVGLLRSYAADPRRTIADARLMRVVIADDHPLFRDGLRSLLEARGTEVLGEARNGREAVELAASLSPDVVLMDLSMPELDGLAATRLISAGQPEVKVVILTASEDDADLFEAIKSGAHGYIFKNLDSAEIFRLLDGVAFGEPALTPALARKLLMEFARPSAAQPPVSPDHGDPAALTEREREVLSLLVQGITSNHDLAERLVVSENTVKYHLRNILQKLHVQNRAQVVAYAVRHGLVSGTSEPMPPHTP